MTIGNNDNGHDAIMRHYHRH